MDGATQDEGEAVTDPRHRTLLEIVKRQPSDFAPWGERSREEDWGPDCSCGCRWYVRLEPGLQLDWGVCRNAASPRAGLLTFEHQGCRQFEADEGVMRDEEEDPRAVADKRSAERLLLRNLRDREPELRAQLEAASDHWGYEDPVYRLYHQSFKVYWLQGRTQSLVALLAGLAPPSQQLDPAFLDIVRATTGKEFVPEHNARWAEVTRPIVEAFFHARYFVEMAVRYARVKSRRRCCRADMRLCCACTGCVEGAVSPEAWLTLGCRRFRARSGPGTAWCSCRMVDETRQTRPPLPQTCLRTVLP